MLSDRDIDYLCSNEASRLTANLQFLNDLVRSAQGQYSFVIHRFRQEAVTNADLEADSPGCGDDLVVAIPQRDLACTYLGKIKDLTLDDSADFPYPLIRFHYPDGLISHEYELKLYYSLAMPANAFLRTKKLDADNIPNNIFDSGIYISAGDADVGAILTKLGFEGSLNPNLPELYRSIQDQNETIAASFFFRKT